MTAITALLLAATLAQAQAPGTPVLQEKGTAVVKGRITAADTGRPLRRARVTLSGTTAARSTSTNVRGEYELRDVPAGRYQLEVQRSGYLRMAYGQRLSGEPAKPLEIAEGSTLTRLDVALPRASVISGRLLDETGEPIPAVHVWAARSEFFRGRRRLVPAAQGQTDDAGNYRLVNVAPGQYVVMAIARETWVARDKHTYSYAPTFFPGTARAADATPVTVAPARETPNVDFAMVASRAALVSGTAMRGDGMPLAGGQVSLTLEMAGPSTSWSTTVAGTMVNPDGTWQLRDVPPGEYRLEARSQERGPEFEQAAMTVVLQGPEVGGIAVATLSSGKVSGEVVTVDGRPAAAGVSGPLRVMAESVAPDVRFGSLLDGANGLVGQDGRFTLGGVRGPSVLRVVGMPPGWAVKSVDGEGRDYAEAPIDVSGGKTIDVRIVLTNSFPDVLGRISDEKGQPVDGVALLVPADDAKWFDSQVLRSARPGQSGIFRMPAVRPGEYFAVALESVLSWQVNDPEFLDGLRTSGTPVTVREGQPQELNLRVVK